MFEVAVGKLVKTIGPDVYLPSPSVASSENLFPLALVERKASRWWLGSNSYFTTEFKINDVIDDKDFKVDTKADEDFCSFDKSATISVAGKLSGSFRQLFDAELSNVDKITINANLGELSISEISCQTLLESIQSKKLNMDHQLIRELAAKKRRALCVVIGVVKTTKPSSITADLNMSGKAEAGVDAKVGKVDAEGNVQGITDRKLDLPAGTVLAYQIAELSINDEGDFQVMVSHGAKGGFHMSVDTVDAKLTDDVESSVVTIDQDRLSQTFAAIKSLDGDKKHALLEALLRVCKERSSLDELAKVLKLSESSSGIESVQAVLNVMATNRDDDTTLSLQNMCTALRSLDAEELSGLAVLSASCLKPLFMLMSLSYQGQTLPLKDIEKIVSANPAVMFYLINSAEYTMDEGGLHPPVKAGYPLRRVYIAVCGLDVCIQ